MMEKKFDIALKKPKESKLLWLVVSAKDEREASKKTDEILKSRPGYLLYA